MISSAQAKGPFDARRKALGMPIALLAKRGNVSSATAKRILRGDFQTICFGAVQRVAEVLGMSVDFRSVETVEAMIERQACHKAVRLASLVQGTSGLESQGLDQPEFDRLVHASKLRLLAGAKRRLWDDL